MSPGHGAIQCHVHIESPQCWPKILDAIRTSLHEEFQIDHVTVQPEWDFSGDEEECEVCRSGLCPEDFSEPSPQPAGVTLDLSKLD